jgi:methylmalonyl-CoA mutase C-terminal domain/subunit
VYLRLNGPRLDHAFFDTQFPILDYHSARIVPAEQTRALPACEESRARCRVRQGITDAMVNEKVRVVVAKPGLDGHDRSAKVIARAFRDAGFEVIYTGLRQTPEQIVNTALQEDADVIGLSVLSGAHMMLCPRITGLMKREGLDDMMVIVGGIIPDQDVPKLKEHGIAEIFQPGASTQDIVAYVRNNVRKK